MEQEHAIEAFASLAQPTRLAVFRLLVANAPDGLPAGQIARALDVPHNTLSSHLAVLARAGLIAATRRSRLIIYRAELGRLRALVTYLLNDCCQGREEICAPIVADLTACCRSQNSDRPLHG
jgi:ArsR family transcriptional regulator, arsenate/arsenite/antimonite-responsive transcriptional repressor